MAEFRWRGKSRTFPNPIIVVIVRARSAFTTSVTSPCSDKRKTRPLERLSQMTFGCSRRSSFAAPDYLFLLRRIHLLGISGPIGRAASFINGASFAFEPSAHAGRGLFQREPCVRDVAFVRDFWCRFVRENHLAGLALKSMQCGQVAEPLSHPDKLGCAQLGQRRSFDAHREVSMHTRSRAQTRFN